MQLKIFVVFFLKFIIMFIIKYFYQSSFNAYQLTNNLLHDLLNNTDRYGTMKLVIMNELSKDTLIRCKILPSTTLESGSVKSNIVVIFITNISQWYRLKFIFVVYLKSLSHTHKHHHYRFTFVSMLAWVEQTQT